MKKLFLLFLLILCPAVFAEEEIYLDKQITPQNIYSKMNNSPYASHSTSFSSEKNSGILQSAQNQTTHFLLINTRNQVHYLQNIRKINFHLIHHIKIKVSLH